MEVIAFDPPTALAERSTARLALTRHALDSVRRVLATSRLLFPNRGPVPAPKDVPTALTVLNGLRKFTLQAVRLETTTTGVGAGISRLTRLAMFVDELWLVIDEIRSTCDPPSAPTSFESSVATLGRSAGVDDLLEQTGPVAHSIGFARIGIGFIEARKWSLRKAFIADDPHLADRIIEISQGEPQDLLPSKFEAEVMDRKQGFLIRNVEPYLDRTDGRVVRALDLTSLVVLPLIVREQVVGFIHADLSAVPSQELVDHAHVLAEFSSAYSIALENVVLRETLARIQRQLSSGPFGSFADDPPQRTQIVRQLSSREVEVFELMSRGYTNEKIAQALSIALGTVKSHVKHILRKLEVENRASAIVLYAK